MYEEDQQFTKFIKDHKITRPDNIAFYWEDWNTLATYIEEWINNHKDDRRIWTTGQIYTDIKENISADITDWFPNITRFACSLHRFKSLLFEIFPMISIPTLRVRKYKIVNTEEIAKKS